MISHRPVMRLLAAALVAGGVAACGGGSKSAGNGLESKPAGAILKATSAAAESARSVHVAGSMTKGGTTVGLDLRMVAGVGATGWISEAGKRFSLVLDHSTVYISGTPAFWRAFGNAAVANLLKDRWLKAPDTGSYAGIAQIANLRQFFQQVFGKHGPLAKTAVKTIGGTGVVGLRDTKKGGVLYVATSGKPYPVELTGDTGATTGKLTFSGFNSSFKITPPKNAISVAQLQKAG